MIYTVTLNPAIDYVVHMDRLALDEINRSTSENIYFGGKGINVSLVLKELGIPSVALGFVAGFTGLAIEEEVKKAGIETDFVRLKEGYSRINVKIRAAGETDINGQGPLVSNEALEEFYKKLEQLKDGDVLVMAGSIPASLPADMYEKILEYIRDMLNDYKTKTVEVNNAMYHHNTSYSKVPTVLKYGILSLNELNLSK